MWLKRPWVIQSLNFEDHDLLRTVGRHVGMHINQAESDKRLAELRQIGTYNRLTAFLMHATIEDRAIQVSIKDSGEGMTPQFVRERLFRPFDSTKGSGNMGICE